MNISLLCKWWWKLEFEDGIWQDLVKAKYLAGGMISTVQPKLNDSPIWRDLLNVKHIYLRGRRIHSNNGAKTLFWADPWLKGRPLCTEYSTLYELCEEKIISLSEFYRRHGGLRFRRWLPGLLRNQWVSLREKILNILWSNIPDNISWGWSGKKNLYC